MDFPDCVLIIDQHGSDTTTDQRSAAGNFAIQEYLREYSGPKPLISITCPTVVRLIQVKYPALIDQLIPIDLPREVAARELKKKKSKNY